MPKKQIIAKTNNVTIIYSGLTENDVNKRIGIDSPAQKKYTRFIKKNLDDYTPRDTNKMISEADKTSNWGKGEIIYSATSPQGYPYPLRVYYARDLKFQDSPPRGAFWNRTMMAQRKRMIMNENKRMIIEGLKGK